MTEDPAAPRLPDARPSARLALAVGFALVCLAQGLNLDQPTLWADEAETAAMSRNVLLHGVPVGSDGRNFLTYDNCGQLGEGLVSKRVPWLQYYVGAASLALFGESTFGARALFALLGALCFFPLYALLRGRVYAPVFVATLVLLSPQVVLFQRNGRYYPLLTLLSLVFLALYFSSRGSPDWRRAGLVATSIALFHTHPLMAAGFHTAVFLSALCVDRDRLGHAALSGAAGLVAWGAWYALVPGLDQAHLRFTDLLFSDFARWFEISFTGWAYAWIDFDHAGGLPLIGLFGLLGFAAWKRLPALEARLRDPLFVLIAFDFAIETFATSALVGAESRHYFAVLRYMPHLFVLLGVGFALLVRTSIGAGSREAAALLALMATNLFAVSHSLVGLSQRSATASWWPGVYGEILAPPPDAMQQALERLRAESNDRDDVVFVSPRFMGDVVNFYLGDALRVHPFVEPGSVCEDEVVLTAGRETWTRSTAAPRFALAFETTEGVEAEGLEPLASFASGRAIPTATRPGLNRRSFYAPASHDARWSLYRRQRPRATASDPATETRRDHGIVLITLDTARADLFDWDDPDVLPNLKALFAPGARFEQAVSASPVTGPAHASLFTGLPATEHGVLSNHLPLAEEATTIAEILHDQGYRTGAFVSASILAAGRGFDQGFEHYDSQFEAAYTAGHYERDAMRTTTRAIEWVDNGDPRPFFLWIHYFDGHAPYRPPPDFRPEALRRLGPDDPRTPTVARLQAIHARGERPADDEHERIVSLYRAQLVFVDAEVARLRAAIDAQHVGVPVHFALVADHGEELGEHMAFYEHNLSLYDGVLRVPLALVGPGIAPERVRAQVDPASLAATLLGFADIAAPESWARGLFDPNARGVDRVASKELHAAVRPWGVTLRTPPWKYSWWEDGREELYHLEDDPGETRNLAEQRAGVRAALRERVEREILPRFRTPEIRTRLDTEVDPETRAMLEALGYL